MDKSAIVLAGGFSSRFGQDKGLLMLAGKPLIKYVLKAVSEIVDETIIVVNSEAQLKSFSEVVTPDTAIIVDVDDSEGPLIGAYTGFKRARGRYSLLLPCDTPLVSTEIILFLLDLCTDKDAVIPRYPNGYIEPLQAVYRTEAAMEGARKALSERKLDLRSMIDRLQGVRYVSTLVLQQLDRKLLTFFNINTPQDLKKAEQIMKSLNQHTQI